MADDDKVYEIGEQHAAVTLYDHLGDEVEAMRHRLTPFTILGILDKVRYDLQSQIDAEDAEE